MGGKKVLRLHHNSVNYFDVEVGDPDMSNMLDIFMHLLQGAAKRGLNLPENPSLWYVYKSKSRKLESDKDLLELFRVFHDKCLLKIEIGRGESPCENLLLARRLIESRMSSSETIPSMGYMDETQPTPTPLSFPLVPPILELENTSVPERVEPNHVASNSQTKRIPPTSARRKGIYVPIGKNTPSNTPPISDSMSRNPITIDEYDLPLTCVEDGYDPKKSSQWDTNKDAYFDRLYENGEFHIDKQFGLIKLSVWMIFFDKGHLSRVLTDYCIQQGVAVVTQKSDKKRLTVECADNTCEWRLHASRLPDGYTWAIKNMSGAHSCTRLTEYNPMATMHWAAEKIMDDVKANPDIPGKTINELLKSRYGVMLRKTKIYETRALCLENLQGGHDTSYGKLPIYCEVLKSTNPDSVAHCAWKVLNDVPEKPIQFKYIFIALKPMIDGFKGCRGLIGVDGCHLKGKYGGVVFSAIAIDGNNQIFPLAYGVFENECKETWSHFFSHLKDALKDDMRENLTIISDRQKGIEAALDGIWPSVRRRLCCRHLCANFKKHYPGRRMHNLFWACCEAYLEFTYNKSLEIMQKEAGFGAVKWLHEAGEKEQWARHKFDPTLCSDENTSNFVECFNATLGVDRCSPVLTLLEGIRRTIMVRYVKRQEEAASWSPNGITPKIAKILHENIVDSRDLQVFQASSSECEIKHGRSYLPVNLTNRTCACGEWQISGIPCKHAVRAILEIRSGVAVESYVSSWFSVQAYKMAYSVNFHPVPDEEQWSESDLPNLKPPTMKRSIGRPPRNRRREDDEKQKGKRSRTVQCSKCKAFGHNAKTCKGGLTARELKEQQLQGVRVEQKQRKSCTRKSQPAEAAPDIMGSAPWFAQSEQD